MNVDSILRQRNATNLWWLRLGGLGFLLYRLSANRTGILDQRFHQWFLHSPLSGRSLSMSLPPNAAAPASATAQLVGVNSKDEIE